MGNALQTNTTASRGTASRCARELLAREEYDSCYYVAAYYYLPLRDMGSFFRSVQTGLAQERSNPGAWNSAFHLFAQVAVQLEAEYMEEIVDGIVETGDWLDAVNQELMGPITLNETNQALLACARSLVGTSGEEAQAAFAALPVE